MEKCRFCDFKVVEESGFGDYCEGPSVVSDDNGGEMTLCLSKLDPGRGAYLSLSVDAEWDERIEYRFGNVRGTLDHRTGYDNGGIFEIRFCPMCGREL